ncbi:MAG: DUF4276 family protein [Capsulimonadaceae bacterium]|nr:DUF4276 family protein [Capsulimonadaceae bacterium]
MTAPTIQCIVEGKGETQAVPLVIRRIALSVTPAWCPITPPPVPLPKTQLRSVPELERAVARAKINLGPRGAIVMVHDADKDCPADLGPTIQARLSRIAGATPSVFVMASWEFESWFIAASRSLVQCGKLKPGCEPPQDVDAVRDAKGWIRRAAASEGGYRPTLHQAAFAAKFDIDEALRNSRSFRKFHKEVVALLTSLYSTP